MSVAHQWVRFDKGNHSSDVKGFVEDNFNVPINQRVFGVMLADLQRLGGYSDTASQLNFGS